MCLKLTLLRDELRKNAVQRAAAGQIVQRSGAVWDEQRLISGSLKRLEMFLSRGQQQQNG